MTDQTLSEVSNSVVYSWGQNRMMEVIDLLDNGGTLKAGYVYTRDQETSTSLDASPHGISATDPDTMDVPDGVAMENVDKDLDTVFGDNKNFRGLPLGCGAKVWLCYAADDQASAVAVYPGDKIIASETEPGKVMKSKELSATLINTPTTGLARTAIVDMKIAEKGFIGICRKYNAGHATDDKWILVELV